MFLVVQKITVEKNDIQKMIDNLSSRDVLKDQKGFVDLTVMEHDEEDNVIGVIGRWESKDDWAAWENTDKREEVASVEPINVETEFYTAINQVKK